MIELLFIVSLVVFVIYKKTSNKNPYKMKDYQCDQSFSHILVIINPIGGKRNGCKIFDQKVAPLLIEAGICFRIEVTKYADHGFDLAKTADLTFVTGIISVDGDGHLHQIING
jgi:hypothetical protein